MTSQLPLLFFKLLPNTDLLPVAESLQTGSSPASVMPLDSNHLMHAIKATRGFARLKIALPFFSLDNPRIEAAFDGTAEETHVRVSFYGNFEKLAKPLFRAFAAEGLVCYSVWDRKLLPSWPQWEELEIDKGFAARMSRITERKTLELRESEPDAKRREHILNAFLKSPEFRAEMAKEARLEKPSEKQSKKTYSDYVNCYVRWRDGRPSASELGAIRKLDSKLAAMGLRELHELIGSSPRFLLATAARPRRAAELRQSAERYGLILDVELP